MATAEPSGKVGSFILLINAKYQIPVDALVGMWHQLGEVKRQVEKKLPRKMKPVTVKNSAPLFAPFSGGVGESRNITVPPVDAAIRERFKIIPFESRFLPTEVKEPAIIPDPASIDDEIVKMQKRYLRFGPVTLSDRSRKSSQPKDWRRGESLPFEQSLVSKLFQPLSAPRESTLDYEISRDFEFAAADDNYDNWRKRHPKRSPAEEAKLRAELDQELDEIARERQECCSRGRPCHGYIRPERKTLEALRYGYWSDDRFDIQLNILTPFGLTGHRVVDKLVNPKEERYFETIDEINQYLRRFEMTPTPGAGPQPDGKISAPRVPSLGQLYGDRIICVARTFVGGLEGFVAATDKNDVFYHTFDSANDLIQYLRDHDMFSRANASISQ